jgi:hypothetical protein
MQLFPHALPLEQIRQQPCDAEPADPSLREAADASGDATKPSARPTTKRRRFMRGMRHRIRRSREWVSFDSRSASVVLD